MAVVIDYAVMKARRVAVLEEKLKELYRESHELQRLEALNARRQRVVWAQLVKLGARKPLR